MDIFYNPFIIVVKDRIKRMDKVLRVEQNLKETSSSDTTGFFEITM